MFFDEYNNFVVMSKEYLLPETHQRDEDYILYAEKTAVSRGSVLPNIVSIDGVETKIINNGRINYVTRYIFSFAQVKAKSTDK